MNEEITILKNNTYKSLFLYLIFFTSLFNAQTLGSHLDKSTLALGEVGTLKVSIFSLDGKPVESAPKNELLPFHFEEVKDSVSQNIDSYSRIIEFQIFQEGKFKIPPLDFKIGGVLYHTVPYEVEVINTAKQGDQIHDIMNNREVKLNVQDYWQMYKWYILAALIAISLIFIIYQLIKYGRKRRSSPVVLTNKTLKELDTLKKKKFIENNDYRAFYVEFIDIIRNFLTSQYNIPADVLLTDDLIEYLKNHNTISAQNEKILEEVFLRGDLVKFAKTFPDQAVMEKDWTEIRDFVKRSSKDLELEKLIRKDV